MSILVTCAGRPVGRAIAQALIARAAADLVLVDERPDRIGLAAPRAAERRHGDFTDVSSLPAALSGARTLILPDAAQRALDLDGLAAALDAARAAGVERIVLLSSTNPAPGNPGPWAVADRDAESLVRSSGMGWSILRLQEDLAAFAAIGLGQRSGGRLFCNRATGQSAPVALADVAAAAAAVAADPAHAGRVFDVTGPELISTGELATALGLADIVHKDAKYLDQLLADGVAPNEAEAAVALGRAVREGYYACVSDHVLALTGSPPAGLKAALAAAS